MMDRSKLNHFFERIILGHGKKINQYFSPVINRFELNYFSYQKIYMNGLYTMLANKAHYIGHYFEEELYNVDIFTLGYSSILNGITYYPITTKPAQNSDIITIIENAQNISNVKQQVVITIKNNKHCEILCFGSSSNDYRFPFFVANHITFIEKYLSYLRYQTEHLVNKITEMKIIVPKKNNDYYEQHGTNINNQITPITQKKSPQVNQDDFSSNFYSLSTQERNVLYWATLGKTLKETADILEISPRTVETYRNTAKAKFGDFYTLNNLLYLLGKNQVFDFLL